MFFRSHPPTQANLEIWHYDNGLTRQVSFAGELGATAPDINNHGIIVWTYNNVQYVLGHEVERYTFGLVEKLGPGGRPRINGHGLIAWEFYLPPQSCGSFTSHIHLYDGAGITPLSNTVHIDQAIAVNHAGYVAWTRYDFCPGLQTFVSNILLYDGVRVTQLTDSVDFTKQPQGVDINNHGHVVWSQQPLGVILWKNGRAQTAIGNKARAPEINDRGDILFIRQDPGVAWFDSYLYAVSFGSEPVEYRLTNDPGFSHADGDINNWTEVTWRRKVAGANPSSIQYMQRIRTGDAPEFDPRHARTGDPTLDRSLMHFDGDIDLRDFAALQNCFTGPGDFDRLCDCRFLDIDHDRDVDLADHALFTAALTGP